MDVFNKIEKVKKAYLQQKLDLDRAIDVWIDNKFSSIDMITAIQVDSGYTLDNNELNFLIKQAYFKDVKNVNFKKELEADYRLDNFKVIPLTPEVRGLIKSAGNNRWIKKYGSTDIEWSVVFIDNKPHLARKESKGNDKKFSSDNTEE